MTALTFEKTYEAEWIELELLLDQALSRGAHGLERLSGNGGARLATLYRRTCEQLALARARSYPAYLTVRLERLTDDAHQLIYQRPDVGVGRVRALITLDFPREVRRQPGCVALAAATFVLPLVIMAFLVYARPERILSVVSPDTAASFEEMYSPTAEAIGRPRSADTDWMMFGHYIRNNVGVAFQCFAGGLFAGLGSLFFLAYNGAFSGGIAGYLTARGLSTTFYSFVATHSAFELTAIVLAGSAGLRIGDAFLRPGRLSRRAALVEASRGAVVVLYGVTAMLVVAAMLEAFWSSASWLAPQVKFASAVVCWSAVLTYFDLAGTPCRLTRSRCAFVREHRSRPATSACASANAKHGRCTRVTPSSRCRRCSSR